MPPDQHGDYLLQWWCDMGMVASGGMGPAPLRDIDIAAWRANVCIDLTPWEVGIVKELSRAYLHEHAAAQDPLAPPPYGSVADTYDRAKVASRLGAALRAAARAPRKGGKA